MPPDGDLLPGTSPDCHIMTVLDISRPILQSDGNSLQLPVVALPAWAVVLPQVGLYPYPGLAAREIQ